MKSDYNHIREWLLPQLAEKGLSIEQFARACGLSRVIVYFYMDDKYRPDSQIMAAMCDVLEVPLEEGLRQYTPRKRGRPEGYRPGAAALKRR